MIGKKITDKLFAHIHNDAYLIGSRTLEGEDFRNTTSYLLGYVQYLQSKGEIQDKELLEKLQPLIPKIEYLRKNAISERILNLKIKGLTETELAENQDFKEYTDGLAFDVMALSNESTDKNSLMISGGWNNSDGGHAMVYEFKRNEQGDLLFLIHNSGAGISYHNCVSQEDKDRYCPVKVYKINQSPLDPQRLAWFMGELVKPNLSTKGKKDVTAKHLYNSVFPQIAFLEGELEDPFQHTSEENLIMGQRSGTCAEKVLHVIMKAAISDKKEYKNFIYGFKKYALDEYLAEVKRTGRQNEAGVAHQILLAVANMSRMLLKKDYFNDLTKERELLYLKNVQAYIQSQIPSPSISDKASVDIERLVSHSQDEITGLKMPSSLPISELNTETQIYTASSLQVEDAFDFQKSDFIEALQAFNEKMKLLAAQDSVAAHVSIEKFLIKLTDNMRQIMQGYDSNAKTESKQQLADLLSELNKIYVGAYRKTNKSRLTPQFFVSELSLLSVLSSIESVDNAEGKENASRMLELVRLSMSDGIRVIPDKLDFSSEDYLCDKKLLELVDNLAGGKAEAEQYSALKKVTKSLYEQIIKKNLLFDGLAEYYSEYCEKFKLKDSEKVNDSGEFDMRSLFMMQKYFELKEEAKIAFIEDYCRFHNIDDASETLGVKGRFQSAEADFVLQNKIEREIAIAWSSMCDVDNSEKIEARAKKLIDITNRGWDFFNIVVDASKSNISKPKTIHCAPRGILDTVSKNTTLSTNRIQITDYVSGELSSPRNVKLIRELLHISKSVQPLSSMIDFFSQNLKHISDPEILLLVEKYIFFPAAITKAVEGEAEILEKLHNFLQQGILAFTKGVEPTLSAITLHKMQVKLFLYEKQYYINKRESYSESDHEYAELTLKIHESNKNLNSHLKYIDNQIKKQLDDPQINASLYCQKAEILRSLINELSPGKKREAILRKNIESFLRAKEYATEQPSKNLIDADRFAHISREIQLELSQMMASDSMHFNEYIKDVMSDILKQNSSFYESKLKSDNIVWDVKLPFIILYENNDDKREIVSIDLCAGKISRPGLNPAKLPASILYDRAYIKLFKDYNPAVLSNAQGNYFEFDFEGVHYRIQTTDSGVPLISRQYEVLDLGARWYQYTNLQDIQGIHPVMQQSSYVAWIAQEQDSQEQSESNQSSILLISKSVDMNPEYCYQSQNGRMIKLNQDMGDSGYSVLDKSSALYLLISNFEDPNFVTCLESQDGYQIQLPRYNLTLDLKKSQTDGYAEPEWHAYIQGTEYELELKGIHNIIPGLRSGLVFSNQKDKKVLFPVQPFVVDADLRNASLSSNEILSFQSTEMPALIIGAPEVTSSKVGILEDPAKHFEQKSMPSPSSFGILGDPAKHFEQKSMPSPSSSGILGDPAKRFEQKSTSSASQSAIRDEISSRLDEKISPNVPKIADLLSKPNENIVGQSYSIDIESVDSKSDSSGSERTEYYNLTPDIHDYIRQDFHSTSESFDFMRNPAVSAKFLNYDGTCQFFEYRLDNDQLLPSNMAQGLYLSYMYLCMNDTQKSLEVLNYCESHFSDLSGTDEEFKYLQWMIFSAPAKFKASKIDAELQSPEVLSVKLKALGFAARFKNNNPDFKIESSQMQGKDEYTSYINAMNKSFYENLEANIYALYYRYLHTEENVPSEFRLDKHEKTALLRSVFMKNKSLVSGPLAVSHRTLEVQLLQSELRFLEQKASEYTQLPEKLSHEIEDLKQRLSKDKAVEGKVSTVEIMTEKIKVPTGWNYKRFPSSAQVSLQSLKLDTPLLEISSLLKFPIDEMSLISSLPKLLDAIYSNALRESDVDLLKHFSEQSIKAYVKDSTGADGVSNAYIFSSYILLFSNNIQAIRNIEEKKRQYKKSTDSESYERWLESLNSTLSSISNKVDTLQYKELKQNKVPLRRKGGDVITTQSIAELLSENIDLNNDIKITPYSTAEYELRNVLESNVPSISSFYAKIDAEKFSYAHRMNELKLRFSDCESIDSFEARFKEQSHIDTLAGQMSDDFETAKNKMALKHLGRCESRNEILKILEAGIQSLEEKSATTLDEIYTEANRKLNSEELVGGQAIMRLELLGKKRNHLAFSDVQRLYLNGNLNETMQLTGLNKEESIALHEKISKYYSFVVQKQQYQRITKTLSNPLISTDIDDNSPFESQQTIAELGQLLVEGNLISPVTNPALMIFQADQNILIRSNQKDNIEELLKISPDTHDYESKIIQLIMGGGKSKVLLPILALKRATGENLSIIEVPESLYKTNFADLNQISLKLFGQQAYGLHFYRHSPSDSASLKKIFRELKFTSVNRGYVVSTRETMASLELKYHELLSQEPSVGHEEWKKQVKWLDRIINFRTHRGDVLIDEVDSGLDNRRQINYTVGDKELVPGDHIHFITQLYEFMNIIDPAMLDALLNTESLSKTQLQESLDRLTNNLIFNPASPVYQYIPDDMGAADRKSIVEYLLNQSTSFPACLNDAMSADARFSFNLLKGELNHLLPHTLLLKLYENYGPSLNPQKSLIEKCISIPYGGNTEPKETSKDTNHLKTINLTIQSVLTYGCSEELLRSLLMDWRNSAQNELLENPSLKTIDNTEIGKAINSVLNKSGLNRSLSEIHLDEESEFKEVFKFLRMNRPFLFYVLQEEILPKMEIESKVLTHNPVNHACLYRTVQGITGTPWNWRTFHQALKFNQTLSLGTDGLTIARLRTKNTKVYDLKYDSVSQYLRDVLLKIEAQERVRAIIDVGATFRGVSNVDAAHQIVGVMHDYNSQYNANIKYVLFFDKNSTSGLDEIYALSVEDPKAKPICLTGKSPSEIESLLKCTPNEYFTYYDQRHTIGTDIKQDPQAKAIVTVDKLTLKKDLCQGVMRMRGFAGAQSVDIVVSPDTKRAMTMDETINIEHVIRSCEENEINRLLSDQFSGALQKIENMIAFDLKSRILKVDSSNAEEKKRLHKIFEPLFIQSISEKMIESYGMIERETDTKDILEQSKKTFFAMWLAMLDESGIVLTGADKLAMDQALNTLISTEIRNCANTQMFGVQAGLNQTAESRQESQQQAQAHKDQNQQQEQESSSGFDFRYAQPADPLNWLASMDIEQLISFSSNSMFDTPYYDDYTRSQRKGKIAISMPEFMMNPKAYNREEKQYLATSGFDTNIFHSYNYHYTYRNDDLTRIYPEYQKQIHAILMIQTMNGIKSMIITYDEAKDIDELLSKSEVNPPNYVWLINSHETKFSGTPPAKENLHPNYKSMIQQLRFYNGDLGYLLEDDLSGSWLMENYQEKMAYFEKNILPYRMVDKSKMQMLHKKINSLHEAHASVFSLGVDTKEITRLSKKYPLLNRANLVSLRLFHKFSLKINQNILSGISPKELGKFISPYYFRLILEHGNPTQLKNYLALVDDAKLNHMIQDYLKEAYIKHDYASVLKLYRNPALFDNENAKQLFAQVLGKCFENPEFTKDMCEHAVDEDISSLLSIISLEDRIVLIQKLPASTLTDIFSKDLPYIKMFLDGIPVEKLNASIETLQRKSVPVIEDGYETEKYNYNYLINNEEKFNYLLSHFDESYVKQLFAVNSAVFVELFESAMLDPQQHYEKFIIIFNLIKPTLTEDNTITLWKIGLSIEAHLENISDRKFNPIEFLASEISHDSFIPAIRESSELFLTLLSSPAAELHYDFIWQMINSIESESEKYKLITSDLLGRGYPFNYVGPIRILEDRYKDEPKPDLYYRLVEIDLKHQLVDAMREVYFSNRFWSLGSAIDSYVAKIKERPDIFSPLTDFYIGNHLGEKFYLQDIIQTKLMNVMRETYVTSDQWSIKPVMEAYVAIMNACPDVLIPFTDLYIEDDSAGKLYLKEIIQQKCDADLYDKYKQYFELKPESSDRKMKTFAFDRYKSDGESQGTAQQNTSVLDTNTPGKYRK